MGQPFLIGDQEVNISASLGIALADEQATPETLLRDADFATTRAKERGGSRIELFDETLRSRAAQRLATGRLGDGNLSPANGRVDASIDDQRAGDGGKDNFVFGGN